MRTKTILAMVVLLLSAMTLLTFSLAREKKVIHSKVKTTGEQTLPLRPESAFKKLNPNQAAQKSSVTAPARQVKVSPNLTIKQAVKKN